MRFLVSWNYTRLSASRSEWCLLIRPNGFGSGISCSFAGDLFDCVCTRRRYMYRGAELFSSHRLSNNFLLLFAHQSGAQRRSARGASNELERRARGSVRSTRRGTRRLTFIAELRCTLSFDSKTDFRLRAHSTEISSFRLRNPGISNEGECEPRGCSTETYEARTVPDALETLRIPSSGYFRKLRDFGLVIDPSTSDLTESPR